MQLIRLGATVLIACGSDRKESETGETMTARQRRFLQKIGHEVWNSLFRFYSVPFLPLERAITWVLIRNYVMGQFRHIRITDLTLDSNPYFLQVTLDALVLIEKHDARRLRRVLKEVRFIVSDRMNSFGSYRRFQRTCAMNFRSIPMNWEDKDAPEYVAHYEWWVARCASTIIHEATHGRLCSLGFAYNKKSRARIERICVSEQRRFASQIPIERYNFAQDLVVPFDPVMWLPYWNRTWRQHWREVREAFREIYSKETKKENTAEAQTKNECASMAAVTRPVELPLLSQIQKRRK